MRLETGATRTLRFGLVAIAALAFSIGLALGHISPARAQDDDAAAQSQEAADAAQQAHDAADAAQQALDAATEQRDQLEGAGASQDDIDAANQAIAQDRAGKDAADEAAQRADEAAANAQ
ncbi:hypothetical protein [Candidatus Binatus soli]|jgi:hypothetical protein|uniref:hypothetical protein n=1 Tax=Candidatus Binatus soli TaxID=1953413 RepID=UPI003D146118